MYAEKRLFGTWEVLDLIRLVAVDMDGTLLAPGSRLPDEAAAALHAARQAGATVVLATGRMFRSAVAWAERLGLQGPIIAYNGALVRTHPDGVTWLHQPIPVPLARAVAEVCQERGWYLHTYVDEQLCIPYPDPRADEYCQVAGVTARVDPEAVWRPQHPPAKLLVIEPVERIAEVQATLAHLHELKTATSFPHYLEITHRSVSKGRALQLVARRLGVAKEEVLAVGDGQNDVDMIRFAGMGVAVANAHPDAKRAARFVVSRPYGCGVAEALAAVGLSAAG